MLKKATKRRLADQWGYYGLLLTLVVLLLLWNQPTSPALIVLLGLCVLDLLFFFFRAKMPCGVKNRRDGYCRNRGFGFLGGCTRVEGHRWIKLTALFKGGTYAASLSEMVSKLNGKAAAISTVATIVIALMGVLTFIFGAPGPR